MIEEIIKMGYNMCKFGGVYRMVRYSLGKRAPARACRFESCPLRQLGDVNTGSLVGCCIMLL